jgi:hypothetical protein
VNVPEKQVQILLHNTARRTLSGLLHFLSRTDHGSPTPNLLIAMTCHKRPQVLPLILASIGKISELIHPKGHEVQSFQNRHADAAIIREALHYQYQPRLVER